MFVLRCYTRMNLLSIHYICISNFKCSVCVGLDLVFIQCFLYFCFFSLAMFIFSLFQEPVFSFVYPFYRLKKFVTFKFLLQVHSFLYFFHIVSYIFFLLFEVGKRWVMNVTLFDLVDCFRYTIFFLVLSEFNVEMFMY